MGKLYGKIQQCRIHTCYEPAGPLSFATILHNLYYDPINSRHCPPYSSSIKWQSTLFGNIISGNASLFQLPNSKRYMATNSYLPPDWLDPVLCVRRSSHVNSGQHSVLAVRVFCTHGGWLAPSWFGILAVKFFNYLILLYFRMFDLINIHLFHDESNLNFFEAIQFHRNLFK